MNARLPAPRRLPHPFTEEALALVRATHADFQRLPIFKGGGRILSSASSTTFGRYDFTQVRAQSELFRVISIVEAYIATLLEHSFNSRTTSLDVFFQKLADTASRAAEDGWEARRTAFTHYFGVNLGDARGYSTIESAIVARNAIAHGLGNLTRRQQNPKDRRKVLTLGARLAGDSILLTPVALAKCVAAAVNLIQDLDRRVP